MADAEKTAGGQVEEAHGAGDESEKTEEDLKSLLKKVITVEVADAGVLRKALTVTVPREALQQELDKDYKDLVSAAIVPGFRRGRAPRRLVEKRFGTEIGEQVQTRVIPSAYLAAVEKEGLEVFGEPSVWVAVKDKKAKEPLEGKVRLMDMASALDEMKLPEEGDLTFKCEVEVKPRFDLPELEGLLIEKPKLEITDDDVTEYIDRWRGLHGNWAPVEGGQVEVDDLLVCDLRMLVDGKEVKKAENVQVAARPQVIEGVTLAELGDKLTGAKAGDRCAVEGDVPSDHPTDELRGKRAQFELNIQEIKRLKLPPLDKAYLSAQGFDSEAEYRSWVKSNLEGRLQEDVRRAMRNQVRHHLLENTKLDLPEGLSTRQTERAVYRKMLELQRRGVPEAEILKRVDELRTVAHQEAVVELKLHFVLEKIAETLEIEVTEEEINAAIAEMARTYNRRFDRVRDDLARTDGLESLYIGIRDEKCIDKLLEKAKITEAQVEREPARSPKTAEAPERGEAEPPKKRPTRRPPQKPAAE